MSVLKARIIRKKLLTMLSEADDAGFLQLMWATLIIQSGTPEPAKPYLKYPPEAATSDFTSKMAIRKWELDTLILLLLTTQKAPVHRYARHDLRRYKQRVTLIDTFDATTTVVNLLRDLENQEAEARISDKNIFSELSRIPHRQFHWQQGFFHPETIRRTLYVYGHEDAKAYFLARHGFSIDDFTLVCSTLAFEFLLKPWLASPHYKPLAGKKDLLDNVLKVVSRPVPEVRNEAIQLRRDMIVATGGSLSASHLPSILRKYPVIQNPENGAYISPIPELLVQRATSGLYYDFIDDDAQTIRNQSAKRFESYVQGLIPAYMPDIETFGEAKIGPKKTRFDTPDVLVRSGGRITVVIECKATKNTFSAQFAADLIVGARRGINELSRGVVQLWRFFAAARTGVYAINPVAADARGLVVTMDDWLRLDSVVRNAVMDEAVKVSAKHPEITEADRKPVVFCSAHELSLTLSMADEAGWYEAIDASSTEKYKAWDLSGVLEDVGRKLEMKPFPFDMNEVIPWRKDLPEK